MPRSNRCRAACACALALVLSLSLTATALAKGTQASLRVIGKGGKILTERSLKTGTIAIKTSPKATCFGAGTGGSGKSVTVRGATALGLLAQAARKASPLRPLLVTDSFDFGLAVCGVGGTTVHGSSSWYLKVNHKVSQASADATRLRPGDEVLWDLAPSYPYPNELALEAPKAMSIGAPFVVHVFSYDERGKRKPVAGAQVTGAAAPTAGDGSATVTVTGPTLLRATHGREIPSAGVCVGGTCASGS
jgi:hypothetical protein